MKYWIFQSKPDRFDLREADAIRPQSDDTWDASRYRADMKAGDIVYFWLAGDPSIRGIYGWGRLVGSPHERGGSHFVKVRYERRLTQFISVAAVKQNSKLKNLWILNMALGTNFLLSEDEGRAIAKMIDSSERPEVS